MSSPDADSPVFRAIFERRSVRKFTDATIERTTILEALRAASWAPSGLNNQPWRFAVIWESNLKARLAGLTRYAAILREAPVLVAVFLDVEASYDHVKDCQAIGACIQNFLLAIHVQDLGAVWIGEILKNKDEIVKILEIPNRLEPMAVIAVGHPAHRKQSSHRRPVEELIILDK